MSRDQSSDQHYWNHQELIRLLHQYHHRAIMDHPERFQSRMDQQSGEEANFHRYLQSVCTQIVPPATRHLQNGSVFSTWKPHKQRRPNTTLTPTKVKSQPSVKSTLSDLRTKFTWFGRSDGSVERSRSHQDINYPPRMIDAWNTESDEPTVLETQNLRNSLSEQKISSVLHPHPVFNPKTPVPHSNAAVILGFNPEANGKSNGNGHAFDRHSPNLEFLQKLNKQYGSVERYSVYLKLIALIHLLLGLFMLIFDLAPPAMLWHMPEDPSRLRYKHLCRLMYPCLIVALGVMTLAASKRRKTITLVLTISSVSLFAFGFIAPPQMPFVESLFEASNDHSRLDSTTTSKTDIRRSIEQLTPGGKPKFIPIGTFTLRSFSGDTQPEPQRSELRLSPKHLARAETKHSGVIRDLRIVYGVFGLTHYAVNLVSIYFSARYYHILSL